MNQKIYPVLDSFAAAANIKRTDYQRMYAQSINDPFRPRLSPMLLSASTHGSK